MPEDTSDKSRKLNTPTIGDLIQWTSILPAHVQLVNLTVNQDPLGSRINYTISQDRTREALTLEAEGLADLTKQPQFKDDNASDKGPDDPHTLRPFSIEEPKPQAASTAKTTPSKQPTKTTEESDDGWEEGWEKKPNYGFDRLPAVPDPPQWADDPDPIGRLSGFTPQPPPPPRSSTSRPRAPPPPAPPRRPTRPAPQPPQPPRSSSSRPGAPPSPPPRPPLGEFNERTSKTDPIYYSPASEIRPRPTTLAALGYSPRLPVSLPPHPPSRVFEAPKDTRNPATRSVSVTYKRITQGGYYPRTGMDYISEGSEGSSRVTYTRPNREREKSPQRVNPFTRRVVEIESGSERGKKTARSLSRSSTESNPSVAASKTSDDPWATWGSTSKKKSDKSSQKSKIPVSSGNAPQRSSSPESWTRKLTRKPRSPSPPRRSGIIKVPGGSSDTINWRAQICELLKTGPDTADDALLESLLKTLKSSAAVEEPASVTKKPKKPKIKTPSPVSQILFRVKCHRTDRPLVYSDFPAFDENNHGDKKLHLKGKLTVSKSDLDNLDKERHGNLSFVVYKDFECCKKISNAKPGPLSKKEKSQQFQASEPLDLYTTESIRLISEEFCEAVVAITKTTGRIPACYPEFETSAILNAPYPWYYIDRRAWKENVSTLNKAQQKQVDLFVDYADYNIGEEYEKIDALLDKGLITTSYLDCLFVPNELVIAKPISSSRERDNTEFTLAHKQLSRLGDPIRQTTRDPWEYIDESTAKTQEDITYRSMESSRWEFDGNFQETKRSLHVEYDASLTKPFPITDLNIYPLKYAGEDIQSMLLARGNMFWACRERKYVYYRNTDRSETSAGMDGRFMVDIATYKKMHPGNSMSITPFEENRVMSQNEPPKGHFLYLLPPTVFGFNMQEKKWVTLEVDQLSDVVWNKRAFDSLVVDEETKTLITAMVTNQIDAEKNTDLISDKGNGLIVLLHGGPGTGKTLTAESVAELSEKPLYRVTCGDIGTNPEGVEKYLKTVLHLGKVWSCVVLLDEADVFLEQRTLSDLHRNALVSVFLRVLEYYDGILVLTSNRVGTFDEAFKSRIQLSLRYENLTRPQRHQIWENFIDRLETFDNNEVNFEELRRHVKDLAAYNMNGRQIRNAITTARQLALYKKQLMSFADLVHVINVASKFDKYLLDMHSGVSEDALAREYAIR